MDDSRADLVVVLSCDPLCIEGVHGAKDGTSEPDGVLARRLVIDVNVVLGPLHLIELVPETAS